LEPAGGGGGGGGEGEGRGGREGGREVLSGVIHGMRRTSAFFVETDEDCGGEKERRL